MKHAVYTITSKGEPVYIGMSCDPSRRARQHARWVRLYEDTAAA